MRRLEFIDQFRGFTVASMLFFNILPEISTWCPAFLLHGCCGAILPADFIASFFLLIVGFCMVLSIEKRKKAGQPEWQIRNRLFRRFILLIVLGFVLDWLAYRQFEWGVLQAIGASGILTYPLLRLKKGCRLGAGLVLLGIYAALWMQPWYIGYAQTQVHGGPVATLSWMWATILGTVVAEIFLKENKRFVTKTACAAVGFALLGLVAAFVDPFDKYRASASESIFAAAAGAAFLLIFYLAEKKRVSLPGASVFGRSALVPWVLQGLTAFWIFGYVPLVPFPLSLAAIAGIIALFWLVTYALEKRGIRIPL
jgi:predicted acyltransferase